MHHRTSFGVLSQRMFAGSRQLKRLLASALAGWLRLLPFLIHLINGINRLINGINRLIDGPGAVSIPDFPKLGPSCYKGDYVHGRFAFPACFFHVRIIVFRARLDDNVFSTTLSTLA